MREVIIIFLLKYPLVYFWRQSLQITIGNLVAVFKLVTMSSLMFKPGRILFKVQDTEFVLVSHISGTYDIEI